MSKDDSVVDTENVYELTDDGQAAIVYWLTYGGDPDTPDDIKDKIAGVTSDVTQLKYLLFMLGMPSDEWRGTADDLRVKALMFIEEENRKNVK